MAKLLDALRKLVGGRSSSSDAATPPRRDPQFVGRSNIKDIEQAPPERVGELVGHAVERVDT